MCRVKLWSFDQMVQKKITLILGAGASAPFGFPTGYELLRRVIAWADVNPGQTNPNLFSEFDRTQINEFREALEKSGKISVDSFLERRPEFIRIGKRAMAMVLIQCEHQPHLFKRDGKSWYEYLFNQLDTQFDDFNKNQLSVLTFNYDRSLEHFLFTALKNVSGKSEDECAEKLKSIPIIHLHGDLRALPYTNNNTPARPYNSEITVAALNIATNRMKIIHEGIANDTQFAQAHKILSESEIICFLGFGYHPLNMERLGFKSSSINHRVDYPKASKKIIGTTYGLTGAECKQIDSRYGLNLGYAFDAHTYCAPFEVFQYLRESGVLH
jgi:hypothetical protein